MTDYNALCERLVLPLVYDKNVLAVIANLNIANADRHDAADAIHELRGERNQCICALIQVSFYARINHGTKCKDYGEVVDGILEKLGIPLGQLMTASEIDAALAGEKP